MRNNYLKMIFVSLLLVFFSFSLTASAAKQLIVTTSQANAAYEYALEYVNNQVAYLYGGRLSVEDYLSELALGKEPGTDIGVDASALVVNAYRSVVPSLGFWLNSNYKTVVADATSTILANFNSKPITEAELVPGDLIFFKNANGNISGVAIFSAIKGDVIHFITASANAGQVILTNARLSGNYWQTSFAGFGRLQYTLLP